MSRLSFTEQAWDEYLYWQTQDKKMLKKVNRLLQEIQRNNFSGIGKPEPLTGNLSGYWSRRIDSTHRLVYKVLDDNIIILQCKGHYSNK